MQKKGIIVANSSKSSDQACASGSKTQQAEKAKPNFAWKPLLIWSRKQPSLCCGGARAKRDEKRNAWDFGETRAREWGEERRREMVRRDSGKQTKRHPWVISGITWIISLVSHYTYFSWALGKIRHVISFWIIQERARLKPPGLGVGAPWGGWGGGEPLYKIPVSKGLGAQVMHKALTVCPHCLLHKRGWDWEKGGSFQDTGQQLLECPDPPQPLHAIRAAGRGRGRRDTFVPFFFFFQGWK